MVEHSVISDPPSRTAGAPPVVGVIYNPRSHRNRGRDLEIAKRPNVHFAQPQERSEIRVALQDLAGKGVEYLIINGGDGTVRDVLTAGLEVFGNRWPVIAVLPKGKTNALNVDLGAPPGWNLPEAIDAFATGERIVRRPVVVTPLDRDAAPMAGFVLGAGAYAVGVKAGQTAHHLGAVDSLAVVATTLFGVLQAVFGSDANPWRRGAPMELLLGPDRAPLPHAGAGYEGRRTVLMASTLERFPGGIHLFGALREGLKIAVLDRPSRRALAMLPLVLKGFKLKNPAARGVHFCAPDSFELNIGADFILDGEAFPAGRFHVGQGPDLQFVVP